MNRREFISTLSASALAGCATRTDEATHSASAAASVDTVTRPQFHVFSKMFQSPVTPSPEDLCDLMAAAGYDGVQWTVRKGGHATPENVRTELPRLVKLCALRGLKCTSICTDITDGNSPTAETVCRVAADCGIRQFRTGYLFYDEPHETFRQSMDRFCRTFAAWARLSARCGVKAVYQNHSTWGPAIFGGVVWDIYACLRDLDTQDIGIEFDPMHASFETSASWRHGFARVAPWISAIDLKDFHYRLDPKNPKRMAKEMVAAGEGIVPWQEVRRLVRQHDVEPFYVVHFEYDFDRADLPKTVRRELQYFRSVLADEHDF